MSFHLVMPPDVTPAGGEDAALGLLARAGMVAVRAADLASPCGRGDTVGALDGLRAIQFHPTHPSMT